jgi:hypothetical protein
MIMAETQAADLCATDIPELVGFGDIGTCIGASASRE